MGCHFPCCFSIPLIHTSKYFAAHLSDGNQPHNPVSLCMQLHIFHSMLCTGDVHIYIEEQIMAPKTNTEALTLYFALGIIEEVMVLPKAFQVSHSALVAWQWASLNKDLEIEAWKSNWAIIIWLLTPVHCANGFLLDCWLIKNNNPIFYDGP